MFNTEQVEWCYPKIDFLTKRNFYRPLIFAYFSHPLNYVKVSSVALFYQNYLEIFLIFSQKTHALMNNNH